MSSKAQSKEKFKSKIGGQAVIEGVMMRNGKQCAVAVRKPDGEIEVKKETVTSLRDRRPGGVGDKRRKRYALVQENAFCEGHFQLPYFSYRRLQVPYKVG